MTTDLEANLSDVGYAKVIVALDRNLAAATAGAAETAIQNHFVIPSETQAASLEAFAASAASRKPAGVVPPTQRNVRVYPHLGLALGYVNRQGAASLAADNRVTAVVPAPELSLIRPVSMQPARSTATRSWGLDRMRVPELWAAGCTGKGVIVGHLDTGVDGAHPALKGAIAEFAEFDMAGDQVPGAKPWDSGDHGTHTAGTIVGRSSAQGEFGVAPGARLVSGLVIEGGQVIDRILSGMDWVLSKGARILSMSLGLRGYTTAFQVITDALRAQNVLPVIAVGNEGPTSSRSPGNYVNVLSVGACSAQDQVADFSGSQSFDRPGDPLVPDLVAPGVDVLSCVPGGRYARMNGSSMATPHVAGLAALLLQAKPAATVDELEQAILASCRLPAGMLPARASRGVPDAVAAFTALTGGAPVAAVSARRKPAVKRKPTATRTRKRASASKRTAKSPAAKSSVAKSRAAKSRAAKPRTTKPRTTKPRTTKCERRCDGQGGSHSEPEGRPPIA